MIFAEQRSDTTQFELGQMFSRGAPEQRDYQQAANWFKLSARQGNIEAQYKLGLMYACGIGVAVNHIKAYAWLKVAAAQGSKRALQYLNKLAAKVPVNRLREAHKLSHLLYRRYVAPFY